MSDIPKEEEMECEAEKHYSLHFPTRMNPTNDIACNEYPFKYIRPIACSVGLLTNPHGSVKLTQGDTCVVAAVFGPTEVRISKELPTRGAVDVLYRPKITGTSQMTAPVMDPTIAERSIESILISIFETSIYLDEIPGLGYNIILHEFEDDGCLLSTCINATTVALLDGGCSLRHTVAGITMIVTSDNKIIFDPSSKQLKQGYEAMLTFAISSEMHILYSNVQGRISPTTLKEIYAQALLAAGEVFGFFHFLILKKNQKVLDENLNSVADVAQTEIPKEINEMR